MMNLFAQTDRLPFCCGVVEIGNMERCEDEDYYDEYDAAQRTFSVESASELLSELKDYYQSGIVFQIWFKRGKIDYRGNLADTFDNEDVREEVLKIPGVQKLHTGINPNSSNEIEGYMWVNRK